MKKITTVDNRYKCAISIMINNKRIEWFIVLEIVHEWRILTRINFWMESIRKMNHSKNIHTPIDVWEINWISFVRYLGQWNIRVNIMLLCRSGIWRRGITDHLFWYTTWKHETWKAIFWPKTYISLVKLANKVYSLKHIYPWLSLIMRIKLSPCMYETVPFSELLESFQGYPKSNSPIK